MKTIPISKEAAYIQKAQNGDQTAFRYLVEQYAPQVRKTVIGMLGDDPEADDVAQEVFIRLHKALPQFRGEAKLSTFLHRIAINLSLTALDKRKRRNKWRIFNTSANRSLANIQDRSNAPERKEMQEMIQTALTSLEPAFRSVVVLRLVQGYSMKETAQMLNIPEGTVASRLARAQKKLQVILSPLV